ncbi:MAG: cytochrome P450 [Pseudomonadota bacterium]
MTHAAAHAPADANRLANFLRKHADTVFFLLRNTIPNLPIPGRAITVVTRYRDVKEVLDNPTVFRVGYAPMMDDSVGPFMLARDGTELNERDKGIMRAVIRRSDLAGIRSATRQNAEAALASMQHGQIDLVPQLSRRVPAMLTQDYFGLRAESLDDILRWSRATQHDMFHNGFEKNLDTKRAVHERNLQAGKEMRERLERVLIPECRAALARGDTPDHILARLLRIQFDDAVEFDEGRILSNLMGTLVGGIETTSAAVVQTLNQLFRQPRPLAMAREVANGDGDSEADHQRLYQLCREALRFDPINPLVVRVCDSDVVIARGSLRRRRVKRGATVLVCTRSAMRDGRQLELPSAFISDRPDHHYLHLGYGHHRCLGDHISTVQWPEMVRAVLRLHNARPVGEIDQAGGPFPEHYRIQVDA